MAIGFVSGTGVGIGVRGRALAVRRTQRVRVFSASRPGNLDNDIGSGSEPPRGEEDEEGEGQKLVDSDVILVSRRELIGAVLAALTIGVMTVASQRYNSLRRWSFSAFRGVLKERAPPVSKSSVAIARFMMEGTRNGPEAEVGKLNWINVQQPRLKDRLLLVHIWRSSDARTMETLARVEAVISAMKKEVSGAVATVSVHCAKFEAERMPALVRESVEEMRLRHSVAQDVELRMWKSVGAEQWPTLLILSPNEHRVLVALTHQTMDRLEECLYGSLSLYSNLKLQTSSFPLPRVIKPIPAVDIPLLRYPTRIALDPDRGNSRILMTTLEGKFLMQIGGASRRDPMESELRRNILYSEGESDGFKDGSFDEALFRNPQGIAFNPVSNELAVADAGNNCLRLANLETKTVRTVPFADPGVEKSNGNRNKDLEHSKPWDVTVSNGNVFICLAGSHSIWRLDPFGDFVVFCGSPGVAGRANADSSYRGALFAGPSGLCANKSSLYVSDGDSSTVREVGLAQKSVRTIVGGDPLFMGNLSAFGDKDGYGSSARLQRPMGICPYPETEEQLERLLVADSYNHKIRIIVPEENECRTFTGAGVAGYRNGPKEVARFDSPSGVVYSEKLGRAFVADKNNHCVRVIDSVTGHVSTMKFFGFPDVGEAPLS